MCDTNVGQLMFNVHRALIGLSSKQQLYEVTGPSHKASSQKGTCNSCGMHACMYVHMCGIFVCVCVCVCVWCVFVFMHVHVCDSGQVGSVGGEGGGPRHYGPEGREGRGRRRRGRKRKRRKRE